MKKLVALVLAVVTCALTSVLFACGPQGTVSIKYADAQTIMELLINDQLEYGLLPEPVATKLEKVKGKDYTWHRMSVQELYDSNTKSYPQAVLMVKEDVLEAYPQLVREIENKFSENLTWVEQNPQTAVNAVKGKYASTSLAPATVITKTVIDNCKISWQSAVDSKASVNKYISDILSIDIGLGIKPAKEVTDEFFYNGSTAQGQTINNKTFTFYAPDGAPALAIAKFISDNQNFISGATFNYNVVVADDIVKYMDDTMGLADFIILPVNAGTLKYNNQKAQYKMVSVITHGNLYIMSKTESTLADLDGKKIGVIGEGKVPDLTFKSVLKKSNMSFNKVA
ncbi:MAG: hypothetical protein E7362_01050 [Clostridiales bacterium]|nr:hypothetical protein [Clostridiales bacterium]